MRIIPAIDIIEGKCVRLTRGDYGTKKVYNENPLEVALQFEDAGIEYLHLVDLDGAKMGRIVNYRILEKIASGTNLKIDFGGGVQTDQDLCVAFDYGAMQVTGGSIAVNSPEIFEKWLQTYGPDKIILGADCSNRKIMTRGWEDESQLEVLDFIDGYTQKGVKYVVCTDISKDGMLQGPSCGLYEEILTKTEVRLIASGGVNDIKDLEKLSTIGCDGVIIGKAIYEGNIELSDLVKYAK